MRRIADESGFGTVAFGHAADGNLHVHLYRERDGGRADPVRFAAASRAIYAEAARLGGTVTGEHGVGVTSRDVIGLCRPPAFLAVMRAVKDALDPNGTLNPGKVFPPAGEPSGSD